MKTTIDCINCIFSQAFRITKDFNLDEKKSEEVLKIASKNISNFNLSLTPAQNATPMYEAIAKALGKDDIYDEMKKETTLQATKLEKFSKEMIENSKNRFLTATKIAVAGNIIDLAFERKFDLQEDIKKVIDIKFATDDSNTLFEILKTSKTVVYLGDNTGEHIFDKIYIETLLSLFSNIKIYYFVRGNPIINDVTFKEAKEAQIDKFATIIDSGIKTPGVVVEMLNKEALDIFKKADCIISKGMGNYECLNDKKNYPIFFLLKVKCTPVGDSIGREVGDIVCKKI